MEALFGLIAVAAVVFALNWGITLFFGTLRAARRTVAGRGSFSDNFRASVVGMGAMEVRLVEASAEGIVAKEVQVRGLLPLSSAGRLGFVTSVFDKTSGELEPVLSSIEQFQEPRTIAYQHAVEVGTIAPGAGFVGWVRVGVVLPQILAPPYGGLRNLIAIVRLIDLDNAPDISNGFHEKDHSGLIWQQSLAFQYERTGKGYIEIAESQNAARALTIKIAMAIALWNGQLEERDGSIIKSWIERCLSSYSGERRQKLRDTLNAAMKEAYAAAKRNELSLTELITQSNAASDQTTKYETIELCYDLVASKGKDLGNWARVIDRIAGSLNLDVAELEKIRDVRVVGLASGLTRNDQVEKLLGIDPGWQPDRIKRHLRAEFQKWNNRLTTLPEGPERDSAQKMLDAISDARKRYG